MKEGPRQHFRLAPHVAGSANVKRKDYEEGGQVEAPNEYAAWEQLRPSRQPLDVGDLLETDSGELRICKYIGFEAAAWVLPAPDPALTQGSVAPETGIAAPAAGDSHA